MITKVFKAYDTATVKMSIDECSCIIKNGGTVAFPTETVYGLGANAFSREAVEKLYIAKNRPPVKPLSVCVCDLAMAEQIAIFNDAAIRLFNKFLPGPLTIVLPKKPCVPDIVSAGLDTVGVRVPLNDIALSIVKESGVPIALPSANLSGKGAITSGLEVIKVLDGRVDAIIDAGDTEVGTESTIISLVDEPKVLRVGAIPTNVILEAIL